MISPRPLPRSIRSQRNPTFVWLALPGRVDFHRCVLVRMTPSSGAYSRRQPTRGRQARRRYHLQRDHWRGKPLERPEVINLIAAITTNTGLKVYASLDTVSYPERLEVSDEEFSAVNIQCHDFRGDWDCTVGLH